MIGESAGGADDRQPDHAGNPDTTLRLCLRDHGGCTSNTRLRRRIGTTDGISITADALSLNGGSIKASADGTTDADLAHEAVAADAARKVDGRRVTAPMVTFGSAEPAAATPPAPATSESAASESATN